MKKIYYHIGAILLMMSPIMGIAAGFITKNPAITFGIIVMVAVSGFIGLTLGEEKNQ